MSTTEDEVRRRLLLARETGELQGLLFHSTAEPIVGSLHGDGLGILWTARDPWVSAQYIPNAGVEVMVAKPDAWRMKDRVWPARHDVTYALACEMSGEECRDIDWDWNGRAKSWSAPRGWPTYGEVAAYIEDHYGYRDDPRGLYRIRENAGAVMAADWQLQGQVFVAIDDGLRFRDLRRSADPDLMEREYYDGDGFERALSDGFDGVVVNDHCQADDYGNVPHISFGLNALGLGKVEWVSISAVRRNLDPWFARESVLTPELDVWVDDYSLERRHGL